ncbi:MAG: hypothetical protein H3C26_20640 [Rhodocyclaceae bacterium]|nr:hypothetical protein [Rhodocyclaceae bacterium]
MIPLLPFAAGLLAGGLAVRLWRSEEARAGVKKAQDTLLSAAQSGLTTIREAGDDVRRRFAGDGAANEAAPEKRTRGRRKQATADDAAPAKKAAPRRRKTQAAADAPATKTAAPRRRARKTAKTDAGSEAA